MAGEDSGRQKGLWLAAAASAAALLGWQVHQRKNSDKYGELDGVVSFSSRLVAALRSLENREGSNALFSDPLAELLAGPDAVRHAESYAKVWGRANHAYEGEARLGGQAASRAQGGDARPADPAAVGRQFLAGRLAVRTWWFDTQLEQALEKAAAGSGKQGRRQVVLLGAGMDTRAWRHAFLQGVNWFEVDRGDVLVAKDRALERAGAQPHAEAAGSWKYPLRAGSRTTLEVDLNHKGWAATLQAAGFDPQAPTVWIAEGLLMYLEPDAVANLLEETAGASAPGSALLTQAFVAGYSMREQDTSRNKPGVYRELQATFRWFCGPDPAPFIKAHGWSQPTVTGYAAMAAATGKPENLFTSECAAGSPHDKLCPFISATQ